MCVWAKGGRGGGFIYLSVLSPRQELCISWGGMLVVNSFSFGLDLGGINRGFRWMGLLIVLGWA